MSAPIERLTVLLTPASSKSLRTAAAITGDSETDTVNRAIQTYAQLASEVDEGGKVIVQRPDGNTESADFFQPERIYVREHHGEHILFAVASVACGPGHTYPTAFGWRKVPGEDWEPSDSDDMEGWTALDLGESTRPAPIEPEPEPESLAQRAAREIQALHDPAVVGYVIGLDHLNLTLYPQSWGVWDAWQKRLCCPAGGTTYRGSSATAHGWWGQVPVNVTCRIDRLPKPGEAGGPRA